MHGPAGGTVGMIRVVTAFYARVLESPLLSHHFAGMSMDSLISQQAAFMDAIVRGDPGYSDTDLHQLHAHLIISDNEYDELLRLLEVTLREHGVESDHKVAIEQSFASFRQAIVTSE